MDFVGFSYDQNVSGDTGHVPVITGVQNDDLLSALVTSEWTYPNSVPTGWLQIASRTLTGELGITLYSRLYYKRASSESGYWDWGWGFPGGKALIIAAAHRGNIDWSDPLGAYASNGLYTDNDNILKTASFVVEKPSSTVLIHGVIHDASSTTFTAPSGYTEDVDFGSVNPDMWGCVFRKDAVSSGSTGDINATISKSIVEYKHAFAFSVNIARSRSSLIDHRMII